VPIYEYRCENGHNFEVLQSMRDDPVTKCEECGAPVERVFHPRSAARPRVEVAVARQHRRDREVALLDRGRDLGR
jgi:putative FmdB family regulatory protein